MKWHAAILNALAVLALSSCHQTSIDNEAAENGAEASAVNGAGPATGLDATGAATGLTYGEENAVKDYLMQRILSLQYSLGMGPMGPCTSLFTLGPPVIKDVFLQGSTGKVRIDISVTASKPVDRGPYVEPRFYFPDGCYGAPPGGWKTGQTSTSSYDLKIEKWSSGWRPSSEQPPLLPTG